MTIRNLPTGKAGKIIYWITTIWLALDMISTGIDSYSTSKGKEV